MNNSMYFSSVPDAGVICQAVPSLPAMTPEGGGTAATFLRPPGGLARCRPAITGLSSSAVGLEASWKMRFDDSQMDSITEFPGTSTNGK